MRDGVGGFVVDENDWVGGDDGAGKGGFMVFEGEAVG